eukprot:3377988-Rhodomonas_salina.1
MSSNLDHTLEHTPARETVDDAPQRLEDVEELEEPQDPDQPQRGREEVAVFHSTPKSKTRKHAVRFGRHRSVHAEREQRHQYNLRRDGWRGGGMDGGRVGGRGSERGAERGRRHAGEGGRSGGGRREGQGGKEGFSRKTARGRHALHRKSQQER